MNIGTKGKRVCICGAFDFVGKLTGGQHTKTRELYYALCEQLGKENISFVDTHNWKKHPVKVLWQYVLRSVRADKLIMLPSSNGLKVFPYMLSMSKYLMGKQIYFDVIGGILHDVTRNNPKLIKVLQCFDGIWVEGKRMEASLREQGLKNVYYVRNFKILNPIKQSDICMPDTLPLKLCTFSRVVKTKGTTDAIEAVAMANEMLGQKAFALDIYGHIGEEYREEFETLLATYKDCVKYAGLVQPHESVNALKAYFLLLFPTYFAGEGMPGTLIDALAAGIPTIASDWHCNSEIVVEENTGYILPPQNVRLWAEKLVYCYQHMDKINHMRIACRKEYEKYTKETVIKQIIQLMGEI